MDPGMTPAQRTAMRIAQQVERAERHAHRQEQALQRSRDHINALRANGEAEKQHELSVREALFTKVNEALNSSPELQALGLSAELMSQLREQAAREVQPPQLVEVPPLLNFDVEEADGPPEPAPYPQGGMHSPASSVVSSAASAMAAVSGEPRGPPSSTRSEPPGRTQLPALDERIVLTLPPQWGEGALQPPPPPQEPPVRVGPAPVSVNASFQTARTQQTGFPGGSGLHGAPTPAGLLHETEGPRVYRELDPREGPRPMFRVPQPMEQGRALVLAFPQGESVREFAPADQQQRHNYNTVYDNGTFSPNDAMPPRAQQLGPPPPPPAPRGVQLALPAPAAAPISLPGWWPAQSPERGPPPLDGSRGSSSPHTAADSADPGLPPSMPPPPPPRAQDGSLLGAGAASRPGRPQASVAYSQSSMPSPGPIKTADIEKFPGFGTLVKSLLGAKKYREGVVKFHAMYEPQLKDRHEYQLTLLRGSFADGSLGQGTAFLYSHLDEFLCLCPGAEPFIDGVFDKHVLGSDNSHVRAATDFAKAVRGTWDKVAKESTLLHPKGRLARTDAFVGGSGPHQVLHAWLMLVETYYCVPTDNELKLWTEGMRQGTPNALAPNIAPDETPRQFGERLLEAQVMFARFQGMACVHEILASHAPLWVFVAGLQNWLQLRFEEAMVHSKASHLGTAEQFAVIIEYMDELFRVRAATLQKQRLMPGLSKGAGPATDPAPSRPLRVHWKPDSAIAEAQATAALNPLYEESSGDNGVLTWAADGTVLSTVVGEVQEGQMVAAMGSAGYQPHTMHPPRHQQGFRGGQAPGQARPYPPQQQWEQPQARFPRPQEAPTGRLPEVSKARTECLFHGKYGLPHSTNRCPNASQFTEVINAKRAELVQKGSWVEEDPPQPVPQHGGQPRMATAMVTNAAPPSHVQEIAYTAKVSQQEHLTPSHVAALAALEEESIFGPFDGESPGYHAHVASLDLHSLAATLDSLSFSRPPTQQEQAAPATAVYSCAGSSLPPQLAAHASARPHTGQYTKGTVNIMPKSYTPGLVRPPSLPALPDNKVSALGQGLCKVLDKTLAVSQPSLYSAERSIAARPPRPVSFVPDGPSIVAPSVAALLSNAASSIDRIQAHFRTRPRLLYYFNERASADGKGEVPDGEEMLLGLVVSGRKYVCAHSLWDGGSNCMMMDNEIASELGVTVHQLPMPLTTSTGRVALTGVSDPIKISYGSGENEIVTEHPFLVLPRQPASAYRVLIGNCDMQTYAAVHDMVAGTLTMRPRYPQDPHNGRELVLSVTARPPPGGRA